MTLRAIRLLLGLFLGFPPSSVLLGFHLQFGLLVCERESEFQNPFSVSVIDKNVAACVPLFNGDEFMTSKKFPTE